MGTSLVSLPKYKKKALIRYLKEVDPNSMKENADSNFLHIVEVDYEWKEGLDIWPLPLY